MPKCVGSREQWNELDSFNSDVCYSSVSGDGPVYCRAQMVDRITKRPWVTGRGPDREAALFDVLERARSAPRPATTAPQLQADLQEKTEQLAAATAEVARLKRQLQERSQRPRPDGSQRTREAAP
jgi:hypothetical protein